MTQATQLVLDGFLSDEAAERQRAAYLRHVAGSMPSLGKVPRAAPMTAS